MAGHSGRNGRIEPFDKLCELFGHASVVVVGMAADEVDHLAIALSDSVAIGRSRTISISRDRGKRTIFLVQSSRQ